MRKPDDEWVFLALFDLGAAVILGAVILGVILWG